MAGFCENSLTDRQGGEVATCMGEALDAYAASFEHVIANPRDATTWEWIAVLCTIAIFVGPTLFAIGLMMEERKARTHLSHPGASTRSWTSNWSVRGLFGSQVVLGTVLALAWAWRGDLPPMLISLVYAALVLIVALVML